MSQEQSVKTLKIYLSNYPQIRNKELKPLKINKCNENGKEKGKRNLTRN